MRTAYWFTKGGIDSIPSADKEAVVRAKNYISAALGGSEHRQKDHKIHY